MKATKVYVVLKGERYEGWTVQGVFAIRADARAYVKGFDPMSGRLRLEDYEEQSLDYWTRGCDIISIREYPIH